MIKEINPEYSSEGLMLKLKLQYFSDLMQRVNLLKKTLILGKTEGKGQTEDERVWQCHGLDAHERTLGVGGRQRSLACCGPWATKSGTRSCLNRKNFYFNLCIPSFLPPVKNVTCSLKYTEQSILRALFMGITLCHYIKIKSGRRENNICLVGGL